MANVLTSGAWLSAPTKKPSFLARLLRVQIDYVSDELTAWLSSTLLPTDCISYRITLNGRSSVCFLRGASKHGYAHHSARSKEARSLWERCF